MARTCSFNGTTVRCLKPVKIVNPHYLKICNGDKKKAYDEFRMAVDYMLTVGCGKCFLCKKSYQSKWRLRLNYEYMYGKHDLANCYFVTLTIAPDYYAKALVQPSKLVRDFLEAYRYQVRKRTGKGRSLMHWIVSERGEERGRLHFHGVLFDSELPKAVLEKCWKYGFVAFKSLTLKRCGYVTKYITKGTNPDACQQSIDHQPRVWCSAGIGKCYVDDPATRFRHVNQHGFVPFIVKDNFVYGMPRYFKTKIFTPEESYILKMQYYAENSNNDEYPKPPYTINRWATSSPEILIDEIKHLSMFYMPKKEVIHDSIKSMSYDEIYKLFNYEFNK